MSDYNEQQREAIEHVEGPLLIVAGAGTGKTRVIVEKVEYLLGKVPGLRPESILALTFTNKAADEMRRRVIERLGGRGRRCSFSTFHSFCYGLLQESLPALRALDKIDQWIFFRRHLEELELDYYLKVSEPGRFLEDLVQFCSQCHDNLVSPASYREYVEKLARECEQSAQPGEPPLKETEQEVARLRELAHVYERSEELQAQNGLLSYGAMISEVVYRLKKSPEWLHELQERYAYILVDEFQDTNAAQWELLKLLAGERRNITVVGDDYQAIYRFRGAADGSLEQFSKEDFPGSKHVVLHQNYRSTKAILKVADTAIAMDDDLYRREKRLVTPNPEGKRIEVLDFPNEEAQAEFVAQEIARRVKTGEAKAYSDFAVLYRAHRHRDRLVAALKRFQIPFAVRNLAINNLPPVRDLIASLRAIGRANDSINLLRMMTNPQWKIPPELLFEFCHRASKRRVALREILEESLAECGSDGPPKVVIEFLGRYQKLAQEQRLADWLDHLRLELGLFRGQEDELAWKTLFEFITCWSRDKSSTGMLEEFLEYLGYFEEAGGTINLPEDDDPPPIPKMIEPASSAPAPEAPRQRLLWEEPAEDDLLGKVKLMTVHAAKGLEFEHVFLFHLIRGAFPVRNRHPLISLPSALWKRPLLKGDFHLKEERRLFYVALTRAKSTLTLCTVSNDRRKPSRFLEELRDSNCAALEWKVLAALPATMSAEGCQQAPSFGSPRLAPILEYSAALASVAEDLSLSASGLETYLECPLKYYYSYVWRVPVLPSAALRFGAIIHGAVKQVVGAMAHPENVHAEMIEAILRDHWSSVGFTDPVQERKYWKTGLDQLSGVWRAFSAKPTEVLYQEKSFQLSCGGTRMTGRIDQINRISGKVVELVEYKTGRAQTQKDADRSLQLTIYARACRDILGLEPADIVLYNLATQERLRTTRGSDDFRILEEKVFQAGAGILAGSFSPLPNYRCRYCDFRPICPAHEDSGAMEQGVSPNGPSTPALR